MSTGFSFGAKTTAAPGFGTSSLTFGTPTTQNQTSFGFGATQNPQATSGGFQFGTPTTSAPAPNLFGNTLKPGGFGTPPTQPTGLFGTPASSAPSTGLNFGTPSAPASTGFGFGTQATAAATTSTPGLSFGTAISSATTPVQGLSFGTPAAMPVAPTLSFGNPALSAPAPSFGSTPLTTTTGSGLFGATATTTPSLGLSFGAPTSTAPTFSLGTTTGTTTTGGLTFGLGSTSTAPSTTLNFGLGGPLTTGPTTTSTTLNLNPTISTTTSVGLGGLQTTQSKGTAVTTQKEVPPKEQPLPNEILQTVENFKEMVKQQKLHSSDIARCSVRDFRKVEQEIDFLNKLLNEVVCQLQKNRHLAEKLKYDTAKCLQNVEMAQRTQDTPPGLQYENTAPLRYFMELANQFEREMQALKAQIESADKYVKNHRNPDSLTPQDLSLGMRRLHETFVALAGRLQAVHGQVESQKETYLNLQRHIYNDSVNPFDKLNKPTDLNINNLRSVLIYSPPKVATGPTPFHNLALGNGNPLLQQQNPPTTPYQGASTSGISTGFGNTMSFGSQIGTQGSNTALFGNTFGQPAFNTSSNFQLQKPPTGNKRGKQ